MARRPTRITSLLAIAALWPLSHAAPGYGGGSQVDYVVVGGGPAGFVAAEKLSRNHRKKVVLLEAGPDGRNDVDINTPAFFIQTRQFMWDYYSQPDPNLDGRTPNLWQGRTFGGGTAVNAMGYCRGSASVFDEWAEISGNPGLAWKSLLEDFKATTHYTFQAADYEQTVNPTFFGNGPLEVSRASGLIGLELPFADALKSTLGLPEVMMSDGTGIGVDLSLQTIRVSNRTRSYAPNTFGWLMANRPNVQVLADSWVQRIVFAGKKATGVTYINTVTKNVTTLTAKEVLVAGGGINTPKLLMQSGVGPRKTLEDLKIPVVADIPGIGDNLWDHHYSFIEGEATTDIKTSWQWGQNATARAIDEALYEAGGSGPLGWNNGEAFGATRLPDSVFAETNNQHYLSLPKDRPHVLYEIGGFPLDVAAPNVSIYTAWAALVQPEASGYLTINSSDYRDAPLIHSNYYGSEADRAAIMYAYKQMRGILALPELRRRTVREVFPGPEAQTDEELWKAIQESANSFHHPVGTVALGSVLDRNWRIKGLSGIRVIDSSTMPKLPTCHPQAAVYALAHRAACDIIQADG